MSHSSNPYAAPLADSTAIGLGPEPADLVPRRLEFSGEVTRRHHRDAVVKAGIRKEYRRAFKVIAVFVVLYCAVMLLPFLTASKKDPAILLRLGAATFFYLLGVGLFFRMQFRMLTVRLPGFQLEIGHIKGWLDRDELSIQSDGYSAICPLSMLASVASDHQIGALSFSSDQNFWHTIPMEAFDDPALARSVFSDLQRIRPPAMAQLGDERKRQVPQQPFRFVPQGDVVQFAGKTHQDAADGTLFALAARKMTRRMWITIALFLGGIAASVIINLQLGTRFASVALVWFALVGAMVYFRIWKSRRRAKEAGRVVAMYSKGWFDEYGYCAMTALGQARMAWDFFGRYEITDKAIAFYPGADDACCCVVTREQFSVDEDWQRATQLVHKKMAEAKARNVSDSP